MRFPLRIPLVLVVILVVVALPLWNVIRTHDESQEIATQVSEPTPPVGIIDGLVESITLNNEELFGVWDQVNPAPPEPEPAPPEEEKKPAEEQYYIGPPSGGLRPGPASRLVISKIGVSAPITIKGVNAAGVMQDPNGPWDVVWYDFSAGLGGGNAVFAGHVDYAGVGPAVFWGLGALADGDSIVFRGPGEDIVYRVVWNQLYIGGTAPIPMIVGQNGQDAITLITCGGAWNAAAHDYSHRRVVRALRVS
jgi:sortase (surface protein transpeptidase)